jgi:hypothetical protein
MANRRNVLIGLGGLVAAGGAALGTGAFTTVTAERTVNIQTTGDASAFLALEAADRPDDTGTNISDNSTGVNQNEYVREEGGEIVISLDGNTGTDGDADDNSTGLNQRAKTRFEDLVTVTNNGTQTVNQLTLAMSSSGLNETEVDNIFSFPISEGGSEVSSGISNDSDVLADVSDQDLSPGESINFGLLINLLDNSSNIEELSSEATYTLTIEAQTANSA